MGQIFFSSLKRPDRPLGPNKPRVKWVSGFFPGDKAVEAWSSPLTSQLVPKMCGALPPIPLYSFIMWTRNNVTILSTCRESKSSSRTDFVVKRIYINMQPIVYIKVCIPHPLAAFETIKAPCKRLHSDKLNWSSSRFDFLADFCPTPGTSRFLWSRMPVHLYKQTSRIVRSPVRQASDVLFTFHNTVMKSQQRAPLAWNIHASTK